MEYEKAKVALDKISDHLSNAQKYYDLLAKIISN
jgi:hypothetical protein